MSEIDSDVLGRIQRGKKVTIGKEGIMSILPHRDRMLLLDQVTITSQTATGEFLVTEDVCKGHAVAGGELIFRGVDIAEMSAQLLGVTWGVQHPDFTSKVGLLREIGRLKFFGGPVFVGDLLIVKIERKNIRERILGGPEPDSISIALVAKEFSVRVKKDRRAVIELIKLIIVSPKA